MTMHESISHDQAIELLPWLVNESLDRGEREAVEAHAASCVICRRELAELGALQASISSVAAQVEAPAPDMRRINARIDAQYDNETHGQAMLSVLREFFGSPWRVAFAAQTLALVVVAVLWLQPRGTDPLFQTLTAAEELPAGHYIRVVFDPTLVGPALSGLIDGAGLTVVAGPSPRGVYTLSFAGGLADHERNATVANLTADERVLFAQPVAGGGP